MGLGKTIRAHFYYHYLIKKSYCYTDITIYNIWKNDFEKLLTIIKVLLIHGNKRDREKCFMELENFDVILTTYGTLRNDYEHYEKKFDYCILDEAQNIKNPVALVTESVKSINAGEKFALTGTPMENNLLELWSIFDFIMPGYLYSKQGF